MARKVLTYEDIIKLADDYGVKDNVLFTSAAKRYTGQMEMIGKIEEDLRTRGMMIEKINVKGDTNVDANPLASQR